MWISADTSIVRNALRRIFPMTQACSHVKCAKVKDFSSRARSCSECVGEGSELSILWQGDEMASPEQAVSDSKCDSYIQRV